MFPIQPTGILGYFCSSYTPNPPHLTSYFYMSWEDALWDVLKHFDCKSGSTILLPDFFCTDVIQNMQEHGLRCVFYPVAPNLQTSAHIFAKRITETKPNLVVIFHFAGISNTLFESTNIWLPTLPKDCLLLEDCVSRVINPNDISLLTPRHLVLDSLRKVVPLQGSRLFGSNELRNLQQTAGKKTIRYQLAVVFWWILMQCCLQTSTLFQRTSWRVGWNLLAERCMLIGYDKIGDSLAAGKGWFLFEWLSQYNEFPRGRASGVSRGMSPWVM